MERAAIGFRPLYQQVGDRLRARIADGRWKPGALIPSEAELAAELGVSQGTVRKALDQMTAERLLTRRQGRGTYVAEHDEARILFQFFKLQPVDGPPVFPESEVLAVGEGGATPEEAERLGLARGEPVIRIHRLRSLGGRVCIDERIVLPEAFFPGLAAGPVPNNLYALYARAFGITVARAEERLTAVAAPPDTASRLAVPAGSPLLAVDRLAIALDGRAVEWRVSLCAMAGLTYVADRR